MPRLQERPGLYLIGSLAYLISCALSSAGFVILERGTIDLEMLGAIALAMALFALIPFSVIKGVLGVFRWDGLIAHIIGGSVAGVWGVLLFLSHGEAFGFPVVAFFAGWGAIAGLLYWVVRRIGTKMLSGSRV
jgi:hypothetical protein